MTTDPAETHGIPSPDVVLIPDSDLVTIEGLEKPILEFAVQLAYAHWLMLGLPLVVMSARDTATTCILLHTVGRAIDLKTHDLDEADRLAFTHLLDYAAAGKNLVYTVGLAARGVSYIHIELANP